MTQEENHIKKSVIKDADNLPLETADSDENDDDLFDSNAINSKKRSKARIIRSVWYNREKNPEKPYRELIMLFTSWRNEDTDLLADFSFYQERFLNVKDSIDEQMNYMLFAVKNWIKSRKT